MNHKTKKKYSGDCSTFEAKLHRVMKRLGVEKYNYDWSRAACFVEMHYNGKVYRFDNSIEKSKMTGAGLKYVSDLFAQIVLSLEGLARAIENDIFTLDMLMTGIPTLPEAVMLEPCFVAMGFSQRPKSKEEIKQQYRKLSKVLHPDVGGNPEVFNGLIANYEIAMKYFEEIQND